VKQRAPQIAREHEFEAQYGLPEELPAGERVLWQGSPRWDALARGTFHADKAALYFGALLVWHLFQSASSGMAWVDVGRTLLWLVPMYALGVGLLVLLAKLTAKTTVYTLTNRRVVMRFGIVLTVAYNLPLKRLERADLRAARTGTGDIVLTLEPQTRIAWLHLWPHVRPWRVVNPQPMLRGVANADQVAGLLTQAWSEANAQTARAEVAAERPASDGRRDAPAMAAS
jgi:Bacterial PH domain